jgi:hypothetical protein
LKIFLALGVKEVVLNGILMIKADPPRAVPAGWFM